ncbi:MAG: GspH/FimT family pseudopilin, partial [Gemmatimonadales bacterium]
MRAGLTLPEMALCLAVAGLTLGIALPRVGALRDSLQVERAAQEIAAALRRARTTAVLQSRLIELSVGPDVLAMRLEDSAGNLWAGPGPTVAGVAFGGPERTLTFSPVGITTGLSNASFRLSRGGASRTVVVSRLGRVRILRTGRAPSP